MTGQTLKAVIIEVTGGNVRNFHVNLRGALGFFPEDCLGGRNESLAGKPIKVQIGPETVETDIDETKAIFRERGAVRRFFEDQSVLEGDLILTERVSPRSYNLSKASKRAFKYHL